MFIAMPFLEDLRHYLFSSLDADSKNIPTGISFAYFKFLSYCFYSFLFFSFFYFSIFLEEQLDAVDDLITDMDLTAPIQYGNFCVISIYKSYKNKLLLI